MAGQVSVTMTHRSVTGGAGLSHGVLSGGELTGWRAASLATGGARVLALFLGDTAARYQGMVSPR